MKKAIVIHPGGATETLAIDPTTELSQLQATVGGYIEAVYPSQNTTLWCNEDAKHLGLAINDAATMLWRALQPASTDVLRGAVVVTGGADGSGDSLAIAPETEAVIAALIPAAG